MRIGLVSTMSSPVSKEHSGSVELLMWLLTREFVRAGQSVTLFAASGSDLSDIPQAELIQTLPGTYARNGSPEDWQVCEWVNLCRAVELSERFDVLHTHAYLWGLPLEPFAKCPLVHTMHVQAHSEHAKHWKLYPRAHVTAISNYQWHGNNDLPYPPTIVPHGTCPDLFTFRAAPSTDEYICFLGRMIKGKGVLQAIAAARECGIPLKMAANASKYYDTDVAPQVDGKFIQYLGPVTGAARDQFLGGARALVYPNIEPEPFGLVLIEAMMCGTPVVATPIGAVPEIVDEAVTGYFATTPAEFAAKIKLAAKLDRRRIREAAIARFSASRMAAQYLDVYRRVIAEDGRASS